MTKRMKLKDTKVSQAGVMRCCLATMDEYATEVGPDYDVEEGSHVPCKYEKPGIGDPTGMVLYHGTWEPAWWVEGQDNDIT